MMRDVKTFPVTRLPIGDHDKLETMVYELRTLAPELMKNAIDKSLLGRLAVTELIEKYSCNPKLICERLDIPWEGS